MENKDHVFSVTYSACKPINIGDVYYRVERVSTQRFTENCLICDGKGSVDIKGYTVKCPACSNYRRADNAVDVGEYAVRRYRIFGVNFDYPHKDWAFDGRGGRMFVSLYHKTGVGYYMNNSSNKTIAVDQFSRFLNGAEEESDPEWTFYDNYKLAVAKAAELNAEQLVKLEEFDATFGTEHAKNFVPKVKNDPKSK